MDKTIVISLLIFFLLLYIEWNNINSPNISFMYDHRFIPHHKLSVTSLFRFQQNVKNKNASFDFWLLYDNYEIKLLKNTEESSTQMDKMLVWVKWSFGGRLFDFIGTIQSNPVVGVDSCLFFHSGHVELRDNLLWSHKWKWTDGELTLCHFDLWPTTPCRLKNLLYLLLSHTYFNKYLSWDLYGLWCDLDLNLDIRLH